MLKKGEEDPPPWDQLGEDIDNVLPTERAEGPFLDVKVAGATPCLGGLTAPVNVFVAEDGVEGAECLTDGAILLHVDEVASSIAHLTLGFFDEHGLGDAHKRGVLLDADYCDVAGYESVVCGDNSFHDINVC